MKNNNNVKTKTSTYNRAFARRQWRQSFGDGTFKHRIVMEAPFWRFTRGDVTVNPEAAETAADVELPIEGANMLTGEAYKATDSINPAIALS